MQDFQLLNPGVLIFLWVPLAVSAAGIVSIFSSKRLLETFFFRHPDEKSSGHARRIRGLILLVLSMVLTVFAMARPSWNSTETTVARKGRDVVFVLDVSRSMLAEDLYPNRLERAKLAILDSLGAIENDRVGLVAFAGTAVVKCPLTLDYSFFRQAVELLSPDEVSVGGSMIGDAIRKTLKDVLSGGSGGFKDIILITDGEDQDSYPVEAARTLGEQGVRLIAVGLGDEDTGKRIPITDDKGNKVYLTYDGREIWSRLDAKTLREMVSLTPGGRYLNVATGSFDMGEIYSTLISNQEKRFIEDETSIEYEESFQLFLAPAVILALIFLIGRYGYPAGRKRK